MNRLLELQQKIADDTARSDIECECISAEKDDLGPWYVAKTRDPEMAQTVAEAIEYLTLRGRIEQHPEHVDWVRVDLASVMPNQTDEDVIPFQNRVQPWMLACFGAEISSDKIERNHRFFEEATELVQACGMTASEAHQLVDYTFNRPAGEPKQEVGGVMVTLAALCLAQGLDMHEAGEIELTRIWTKVDKIRAKQAAKPKHSPLPEHVTEQPIEQEADKALADVARRNYTKGWNDAIAQQKGENHE